MAEVNCYEKESQDIKLENKQLKIEETYDITGRKDFSLRGFFKELYESKIMLIVYVFCFVAIIIQIAFYWAGTTPDSAGFLEATDFIARRTDVKENRFLTKPITLLVAAFFSFMMETKHAFALTSSLFTIATVFTFSYFVSKYYSIKMSVLSTFILVQLWPFNMLSSAIMTDACGYFFLILAILYTPETVRKIKAAKKYPIGKILLNGVIFGLAILSREILALFSFLYLLLLCVIMYKSDIKAYLKTCLLGLPTILLPAVYFLALKINPLYGPSTSWDIYGGYSLNNPLWGPTRLVVTINACFTLYGIILAFIGFFQQKESKRFLLNVTILFSILITLILSPVMVSRYSFTLYPILIPFILLGIEWVANSMSKLPYISKIPKKYHFDFIFFILVLLSFLLLNAFLKIDMKAIYHLYFNSF